MKVIHDEKEHKFFVEEQGAECTLFYKELGERIWNFVSSHTPENVSGKDTMEETIEFAIQFVKEHDIKILASCKDVQDFLVNHKDFKDLVYHPY